MLHVRNFLAIPSVARAMVLSFICLLPLLSACGHKAASPAGEAQSATNPQPAPPATDWPIFRGDAALTGVAGGELKTPLTLLWTFKTGGVVNSSAIVANDCVYFGSADSNLYALKLTTGEKLWSFKAGSGIEAPPPALLVLAQPPPMKVNTSPARFS